MKKIRTKLSAPEREHEQEYEEHVIIPKVAIRRNLKNDNQTAVRSIIRGNYSIHQTKVAKCQLRCSFFFSVIKPLICS